MSPAPAASDLVPLRRRAPRRTAAVAASVALHVGLVAAFLFVRPPLKEASWREPAPEAVAWVRTTAPPEPVPVPAPFAAAVSPASGAAAPIPAPFRAVSRPAPDREAPPAGAPAVSDAELAGAARVGAGEGSGEGSGSGGGGGGGACDMPRRLQAALRRDRLVLAAAAPRGGRPLLVWNGDWTMSDGEDGRGLAAVREALIWEIGFAPEACRRQPVSGLVLLSLGDGADAPRLVLGAPAWRWSDLVLAR